MVHNLSMLFLIIAISLYALIHVGAKRAVENYDEGYGMKDHQGSGLQSAPVRIPSTLL